MNRALSLRLSCLTVAASALFPGCAPGGQAAHPPVASVPAVRESPPPVVRWVATIANDPRPTVEVTGLDPGLLIGLDLPPMTPERWGSFFTVKVMDDSQPDIKARLPVLGTYGLVHHGVRFSPRFPLEPGLSYRAEFDAAAFRETAQAVQTEKQLLLCAWSYDPAPSTQRVAADFSLARLSREATTTVSHVYPTCATLPENLLKFYLHFSAPMSRGAAYQHVHLLDASGKALDLPFLEVGEELWDRGATRLTLLFDPGRIKTGLKPREDSGPVLEAGKAYTLVIDREWPDAAGDPLQTGFRKAFRVTAPDHDSPDPNAWTIQAPAAGSREALEVRFPEPLDHALLGRLVGVTDPSGKAVPGDIALADEETRWRFTPDVPWAPGRHAVVVDRDLEDLAGNSVGRPFEVNVSQKVERPAVKLTVALPFTVEAK